MAQKKNSDSFIKQAGILAAAGIICRIIGILYRSPLKGIIGSEGNGYYTSAYNIYTIILLVASYSIPSAISKVISQRLALKEYKNAHRIFQCALIYVVVVGGLASLFAFFGAGLLVESNSVMVLRVFAPTIFLSGILGVFRGYFQAHKTMLQTSFSQIAEQILNAVISILAAYFLIQIVQTNDTTKHAIYGATGSAIGTGAGVAIALLIMWGFYCLNKKGIKRKIKMDKTSNKMSTSQIFKVIMFMVTPVILSTFIYNFSTSLDQTIFTKIMKHIFHTDQSQIASLYGVFAGEAVVIANIPIAIASAMSASMIPTISGTYAKGNIRETNRKIGSAIKTTMLISIPCAVGLFVLAKPIVMLLFPQADTVDLSASLLRGLAITVVFYALSTLTNAVLQGIGKVNLPVINAAVALTIQTLILIPLLLYTDLKLNGLVIATISYSFLMCLLNAISVKKCLGYKQKIVRTYILPTIAALLMGATAYGVYQGVFYLVKNNVIALCVAIIIAAIVYFVVSIFIKSITKEELLSLPKGRSLVVFAQKIRILK